MTAISMVGCGSSAQALIAAFTSIGLPVAAYDPDDTALGAAVAHGAHPATLPADAAESADVVFLDAPDERSAEELLFDLGGVGETLRTGGVVITLAGLGEEFERGAAARLARFGIAYVRPSGLERSIGQWPGDYLAGLGKELVRSGSPDASGPTMCGGRSSVDPGRPSSIVAA